MAFGRKFTSLAIVSAMVWGLGILAQASAQQKASPVGQASLVEMAFKNWLSSFEKSGAKIGPLATRYDAASDKLSVSGLSVSWPASTGEGDTSSGLEISVNNILLETFRSTPDGFGFKTFVADGISVSLPSTQQVGLKIARFEASNGQVPSLLTFIADPSKPFTTQIRLMRALASVKLDDAVATAIDFGGDVSISSGSLKGLAMAKAKSLVLEGIRRGGGTTQSPSDTSAKAINVEEIDFDRYLRLFEPSAYLDRGSARPWENLVGRIFVTGVKVQSGPTIFSMDSAEAGPLKIRQFSESMTDVFDRAAVDNNYLVQNPDIAEKAAAAVRDAFSIEAIGSRGLAIQAQNSAGTIKANLEEAKFINFTANSISSIDTKGFSASDPTGALTLGALTIGGFNLVPVEGANVATSMPSITSNIAVFPTIGSIKATDLSVKLQDISASLDGLDVAMAYFVGATPTNVRMALDHLKLSARQISNQSLRQALSDLGYEQVDVSGRISGSWDDASSAILVDEVSLRGKDMGALSFSGIVNGISRKSIERPTEILPVELAGAGIRNVRVTFENNSLFDRFLTKVAQQNGKSLDDIKSAISNNIPMMMAGISPADLRNRFIFAATSFLNNAQIISFSSTKPDATPISTVLSTIAEPYKLPGLLGLDVSANSRRN